MSLMWLPAHATGLGKDSPGSPLRDHAALRPGMVAWDFNYRGDLTFLRQALPARLGLPETPDRKAPRVTPEMAFRSTAGCRRTPNSPRRESPRARCG